MLAKANQKFIMFFPDGRPARARLTVTFNEYLDAETQVAAANLQTADFSKAHTVKQGDTLSSIASQYLRGRIQMAAHRAGQPARRSALDLRRDRNYVSRRCPLPIPQPAWWFSRWRRYPQLAPQFTIADRRRAIFLPALRGSIASVTYTDGIEGADSVEMTLANQNLQWLDDPAAGGRPGIQALHRLRARPAGRSLCGRDHRGGTVVPQRRHADHPCDRA